jgi:hypothetical protein
MQVSNFKIGQLFVKVPDGFKTAKESDFEPDDPVFMWDGEKIIERMEKNK